MPFVGRKACYRPTFSIAPLQSKVLSLHLSCLVILSITACFPHIRTRIYASPTAKLSFLASEHTQDPIWDCILIVQQDHGWYTYSWDRVDSCIALMLKRWKESEKFQNPNQLNLIVIFSSNQKFMFPSSTQIDSLGHVIRFIFQFPVYMLEIAPPI